MSRNHNTSKEIYFQMLEREILEAKILIVDDSEANVWLLQEVLKTAGYTQVEGISDSREAVQFYKKFKPDLLILDINMPFLDGFQVMEELKRSENEAYLPILVLTSDHESSTRQKALNAGGKDFLTKPFSGPEVLARIKNMLEVRLLHKKLQNTNKILEEKVRERTRELEESRLEIIYRLSLAAEYKDDMTGGHLKRMSTYATLIGKYAGLSLKECELLKHASQMHDIGKLKIPESILHKPGNLTSEEWMLIQEHPIIGAKILSGSQSELLQMAEIIALTHHEKWDGSGYPRRLKGDEIPLVGRICALADVFDALTSERPYKKAWNLEEAILEIENQSGKHFDPKLIPAFRQALPEIVKIKEAQNEEARQFSDFLI
jgi:putative two-component system response regulator